MKMTNADVDISIMDLKEHRAAFKSFTNSCMVRNCHTSNTVDS